MNGEMSVNVTKVNICYTILRRKCHETACRIHNEFSANLHVSRLGLAVDGSLCAWKTPGSIRRMCDCIFFPLMLLLFYQLLLVLYSLLFKFAD